MSVSVSKVILPSISPSQLRAIAAKRNREQNIRPPARLRSRNQSRSRLWGRGWMHRSRKRHRMHPPSWMTIQGLRVPSPTKTVILSAMTVVTALPWTRKRTPASPKEPARVILPIFPRQVALSRDGFRGCRGRGAEVGVCAGFNGDGGILDRTRVVQRGRRRLARNEVHHRRQGDSGMPHRMRAVQHSKSCGTLGGTGCAGGCTWCGSRHIVRSQDAAVARHRSL